MTSTPVKDVGSVLSSLSAAMGNSVKTAAGAGFQSVLSGQTGKGAVESQVSSSQSAVKKTPGDSMRAREDHMARVDKREQADGAKDEEEKIPSDKLEEIMALLGSAASELLGEIADTFGVSMEELQSAMRELGMESLDVLDAAKLSELLLRVAGADNPYALVTDGELYSDYQEMMAKLENLLGEAGEELQMEPDQLQAKVSEGISTELLKETGEDTPRTENQQQSPELQMDQLSNLGMEAESVSGAGQENQTQFQSESEGRRHHEHSDRGEGGLFAQDLRGIQFPTQFDPQLQQTQAAQESREVQTQDIMRQILDYMRIQIKPDASSLEMQLHPESLGTLQIHLASKGGMLTANFIAQNEAVKTALESQMVQLKENFEQQGVKVEAIEVTVQSHAFERNLDQGRGHGGTEEQNPKKTRTRRINLNDSPALESLEEEDALAAEMMAASGSQVDYTA